MAESSSGMRAITRLRSSGWRMPTIQGRPRRSPRIRLSPPAVTVGMRDAPRLQDRDAGVDRVTLGDSAEVDANAGLQESHGRRHGIDDHVPPVHGGQRRLDLGLGRVLVLAIVVEVADARVGDVEGAARHLREFERPGNQPREFRIHLDRRLRRIPVDPGKLAFGLVDRHQLVDPVHFRDHRVDRGGARGGVVVPDLDGDPRAHDRLFARVPFGARGGRRHEDQRDRECESAHHHARSVDEAAPCCRTLRSTVAQRLH